MKKGDRVRWKRTEFEEAFNLPHSEERGTVIDPFDDLPTGPIRIHWDGWPHPLGADKEAIEVVP